MSRGNSRRLHQQDPQWTMAGDKAAACLKLPNQNRWVHISSCPGNLGGKEKMLLCGLTCVVLLSSPVSNQDPGGLRRSGSASPSPDKPALTLTLWDDAWDPDFGLSEEEERSGRRFLLFFKPPTSFFFYQSKKKKMCVNITATSKRKKEGKKLHGSKKYFPPTTIVW